MKRTYRKIIAFITSLALLIGWLPADTACAEAASPGNSASSGQTILVEGSIDDSGNIQLSVHKNSGWADLLTFQWSVGEDEASMTPGEKGEVFTLKDAKEGTCIQVSAMLGILPWGSSRVLRMEDASLEVDLISGVTAKNVSAEGTNDGGLVGLTGMMHWSQVGSDEGPKGDGSIETRLTEGTYKVTYREDVCAATPLRKGLYAYYVISREGAAETEAPATGQPAETKAPADTAEPAETKAPAGTTKPAETKTPASTSDPLETQAPIQVGNAGYKISGSGSVSYCGSMSTAKTVSVPASVKINGKSYPVTSLAAGAFKGSKVQKVKLGKNVKKLGKAAFKNCKSLKKVTFPSKLQSLGAETFSGCTKLGSVALPASVKTVGDKAFKNCKSMKKLRLGKAPAKTEKGRIMFGGITGKKVTIGANALENCLSLRTVIINSQVTKIGNSTFKNCKKLALMLVKSLKLKKVGNRALKGVNHCKISVPSIRLKKYRTLFKNKGQGKKVVVAKA